MTRAQRRHLLDGCSQRELADLAAVGAALPGDLWERVEADAWEGRELIGASRSACSRERICRIERQDREIRRRKRRR